MPAVQPKSLILDVYGGFVRELGGWIAVAHLIALMEDLRVDEQAVRSSISRMKRRGILLREQHGGVVGYALSDMARQILDEGDRRIFAHREPADLADGWALAVFSVPEHERRKRHLLRSRLTWLGFGNASPGVWVAPRRLLAEARAMLERLELTGYVDLYAAHYEGFADVQSLITRSWDLAGLRRMYGEFIASQTPVLHHWTERRGANDDHEAFVDYTLALSEWRRLPFLDPGLPPEMLPGGWEGRAAAALFRELDQRIAKRAHHHVERLVG